MKNVYETIQKLLSSTKDRALVCQALREMGYTVEIEQRGNAKKMMQRNPVQ
jgi:hypothetical protein